MDDENRRAVAIYDEIADKYAKTFDSIDPDEEMAFVNKFMTFLPAGSEVIDLGCGTGFTAGYLTKRGFRVQGTDLSEKMIDIASENFPDITFTVADMRDFDPHRMVDAVWAGYSLFHFPRPELEKTFDRIKTYLKPDGIFGFVVQGGEGSVEMQEPFLPEKKIFIQLYSDDEIRSILESHGFTVLAHDKKKAAEYEFPFDKLLFIAKLTH